MQVPFCLRASGLGPISTSVGCPLPPSFLEADEGDQGHPHGQRRSPVMHKRSSRKHGNRGHVRTGGPPGNLFPNLSYPGFGPEPARPQRSGKHKAAEMDAAARQHSPVTRRVSGDAAVARSDPAPPGGTAGTTAAQAGSSRLRGGGEGRVGARPGPAPAAGRGDTHLGRAGRPRRPHLSHPRGGRRPSPAAPAPPPAQREAAGGPDGGRTRRGRGRPRAGPPPAPRRRAAPGGPVRAARGRTPTWGARYGRGAETPGGGAGLAGWRGAGTAAPGPNRCAAMAPPGSARPRAEARAANGGGREEVGSGGAEAGPAPGAGGGRRAGGPGPRSVRGPRTATTTLPAPCHPLCQAWGHGVDQTGKVPAPGN